MSKKHWLKTKPQAKVMVTDNGRQLYLLEDNGLTPDNINLSMYNITTPDAPVRAQLDRFAGNTDAALMSMSPDGGHLAVAVNKGARGGFMGNTAAGTDLKFYIITTSGETAYILNTCNTGPYVNALSVDFAPDSRYLYFTVGSATGGYRLMRLGAVAKAAEDLIAAGGAASVARAKNGKLYLAAAGSDALTEVTHNGAAAPQIRQLQLGSAAQGFALTGVLPAQPHTALSNAASTHLFSRTVGLRAFELKDHLGNVRATIGDRKLSTLDAYNKPGSFRADLLTAYNYYPFGMLQPGRNYNTNNYRFAYNGKEMDNEAKGTGVQYDYGFRIYDARIARFLSVDPLTKKFAMLSPYQFASNMPISAIDMDGLEAWFINTYIESGKVTKCEVVSFDKVDINVKKASPGKYVGGTGILHNTITDGKITSSRYTASLGDKLSINALEAKMRGNSFDDNAKWEGKDGYDKYGKPTIAILTTVASMGTIAYAGLLTKAAVGLSSTSIALNVNNYGENHLIDPNNTAYQGFSFFVDALSVATAIPNKLELGLSFPSVITDSQSAYDNGSELLKKYFKTIEKKEIKKK